MTIRFAATCALLLALFVPPTVFAAIAQRTFVASYGNDAHPCALAQPCRSFAAAIAKTSSGGEVIVLDSAGYGPVTITQSVSIIAPSAVYAGITASSSAGVIVDGSGIAVKLRGLAINGEGASYGVRFLHGASLAVEACEISNMAFLGLDLAAPDGSVIVRDTSIHNSKTVGVYANPSSGGMRVFVTDSRITDNFEGVEAFSKAGNVEVTVARSVLTGNHESLSVGASVGTGSSILSDGNTITHSDFAFRLLRLGGSEAIFTPGNNTVGYYGTLVEDGTLTPCCGI